MLEKSEWQGESFLNATKSGRCKRLQHYGSAGGCGQSEGRVKTVLAIQCLRGRQLWQILRQMPLFTMFNLIKWPAFGENTRFVLLFRHCSLMVS